MKFEDYQRFTFRRDGRILICAFNAGSRTATTSSPESWTRNPGASTSAWEHPGVRFARRRNLRKTRLWSSPDATNRYI